MDDLRGLILALAAVLLFFGAVGAAGYLVAREGIAALERGAAAARAAAESH